MTVLLTKKLATAVRSYNKIIEYLPTQNTKSKSIYLKLVDIKCSSIKSSEMCPDIVHLCNELNVMSERVFKQQLCSRIEIKLKGAVLSIITTKFVRRKVSINLQLSAAKSLQLTLGEA
jgi:hypothetical protein